MNRPALRDPCGAQGWERTPRPGRRAFTLIEIIGVVAVIAILVSVLVPRALNVIARGKVSTTAQSLGSLRGTITEYVVRSNTLPSRLGYDTTNAPTAGGRFDADLLQAGLIERLFVCSIGSQVSQASSGFGCSPSPTPQATTALLQRAHLRSAPGGASSLTPTTNAVGQVNFDLDLNGTGDFASSQMVAYAYIPGVSASDAMELNRIIDGGAAASGAADLAGRCINSGPSSDNTVTVYVYLAHR